MSITHDSHDKLFSNIAGIPSSLTLNPIGFDSKFYVFSSLVPLVSITHSKWIIDTRETGHMICSISLFISITVKISANVKLPNGKFAAVIHIGTIQISANLTLTNVLCVPSFSFNLLSVSKPIESITC